ncbi:hypothetical protein [Sphingosinithalassobacter sp. LHW66-3]|uniref:hypothetical protein n=1 Tax=Sphingosinithalassobacter sp. LHW66-3 TaxID=3424718 RepID=UPI003D6B6C1D
MAAFLWGERPEREAALLFLAGAALSELSKTDAASRFLMVEHGVLLFDLGFTAALGTLAILHKRWWLIWATAFHVLATLGHLGKLVEPEMSRMAYGLMQSASSYPVLIAFGIGIWAAQRRRKSARKAAHS